MGTPHLRPGRNVAALVAATIASAALTLAGCASPGDGSEAPGGGSGGAARNEVFPFQSAQLEGNLLEASAGITLGVLLPAGYDASDEPLPVVYFLPGYTAFKTAEDMDNVLGAALDQSEPMIVVTITGANELGGGWYTDSPATGNWEQAIVTEVVPYIDANYRTIPTREARGLAGHSMGGYGALTIGMHHPDVFGSLYIMSPAIAAEGGVEGADVFGNEGRALTVVNAMEAFDGLEGSELLNAMEASGVTYELSYALAFSPKEEPPYFDYPYSKVDGVLVRDDAVWAKWEAGFGGIDAEVAEARDALLSLQAVGLECGTNDSNAWIIDGTTALDAALTDAGVGHSYVLHDGTHTSLFEERMTDAMLPFFEDVFAG